MIVDSSAVIAIFLKEPGYENLLLKIVNSNDVGIGAPTLLESAIVLSTRMKIDAAIPLSRFIMETNLKIINFTAEHYRAAFNAWLNYGKGRHPAGLNYGDCLAYAIAYTARRPLLCKGEDFSQTDITLA